MPDIKPCPLCRESEDVVKIRNLDGLEFCECKVCWCRAPLDAWQIRPAAIVPRELARRVATDSLDNARELLGEHDAKLGRTTAKNKALAEQYEAEIAEAERFIGVLDTQ